LSVIGPKRPLVDIAANGSCEPSITDAAAYMNGGFEVADKVSLEFPAQSCISEHNQGLRRRSPNRPFMHHASCSMQH